MLKIILVHTFLLILSSLIEIACIQLPVVIDTDLGPDIDDAFAIAYVLAHKELFDLKLITSCQQNTTRHMMIVAKLLTELDRNEIPLGIGLETPYDPNETSGAGYLFDWAQDFQLESYKGKVFYDGLSILKETVRNASIENPILILGIGRLTNIEQILNDEPDLSEKMKLFIMGTSVYKGNHGLEKIAEYNIFMNITAAQTVFNTKFPLLDMFVTPLDTSSYIQILNDNYNTLKEGTNNCNSIKTLLQSYEIWYNNGGFKNLKWARIPFHPNNSSSPMFDVQAAISLKYYVKSFLDNPFVIYEHIPIGIDDNAFTYFSSIIEYPKKFISTRFVNDAIDENVDKMSREIVQSLLDLC
jgi:inosine-uridine nucleoside N-ribohydrolase